MALSPWQRRKKRAEHQAKVLQERTQEPRRSGNSPSINTTDAQFQVALESDMSRLKTITSHAKRDELKRDELIPRYAEYLEQVLASGQGGQNDVVVQLMVWCLDAGPDYFELAFRLADYAMKHGMATPDNYQRDVRNVLAGQMADWCQEQLKLEKSPDPWATEIFEKSAKWDLVDKIRAILCRVMADLLQESDPGRALTLAEEAYQLNNNVGVMPLIKKLQKVQADAEPELATETEPKPVSEPETVKVTAENRLKLPGTTATQ